MITTFRIVTALGVGLLLSLAACQESTEPTSAGGDVSWLEEFRLNDEPVGGVDVLQAKTSASTGEQVVFGRVSDVVPGFAAWKLTSTSLEYCGESMPEDGCRTPWDYCCLDADAVREQTLLVQLRDDDGAPIAGSLAPDVRPLDLVAVRGTTETDEHGNVTLVASGWFRRDRPTVGDHVRFP